MIEHTKKHLRILVENAKNSDDESVRKSAEVVVADCFGGSLEPVVSVADQRRLDNPEPASVLKMKKKG